MVYLGSCGETKPELCDLPVSEASTPSLARTRVGCLTMAEELEELWKKLTFTEEEDEDIVLGSNSTRVAKEVGKNYIVMKVLTQQSVSVEALKKNMRMLWKPNKGIQISEIEDNLYLAKFGDSRDRKKVMEMRPWSYENC